MSEWFPVNVGLRQCCVMSPCLFNLYLEVWFDRLILWPVLVKGLELLSANGGSV